MGQDLRDLFGPHPDISYLDTATYGLPPTATVETMSRALVDWQTGSADWIEDWDVAADRARASFAALIDVPVGDVALLPAVSVGVGTVAASLEPADRVVVPDDEFTSLLFPLLVAAERGTAVSQVPFEALVEHIEPGVTLVAFSLVQMQTGRVAPIDEIFDRADEIGARVLVDATHGLPFVGRSGLLGRADFVVSAAYKHLLCPRGVAFAVVQARHHDHLPPWNANWRAASDPYGRYVGGPLTLASGAARFNVSVAWLPWLGASVSLALLHEWARDGQLDHPVRLAEHLAQRLGTDWGGASMVCPPIRDVAATRSALAAAGVKAGFRGDAVRLSTHVYSTEEDLDRATEALDGLLAL